VLGALVAWTGSRLASLASKAGEAARPHGCATVHIWLGSWDHESYLRRQVTRQDSFTLYKGHRDSVTLYLSIMMGWYSL